MIMLNLIVVLDDDTDAADVDVDDDANDPVAANDVDIKLIHIISNLIEFKSFVDRLLIDY